VIPESIQEPAVQTLGEAAGLLGLGIAIVVAAAVYGLLAVAYERYVLPKADAAQTFSRLEWTLAFTIVPWLLFGAVVLPLTGESFFGASSSLSSPYVELIFPFTTLLLQLLWGVLLWGRMPGFAAPLAKVRPDVGENSTPRNPVRRTFIERSVILGASTILVLSGLGSALNALLSEGGLLSQSGTAIRPGSSTGLQNAPQIFSDPRLADLVDSEVTDNGDFYQVDIDVFDPSVDPATWSLNLGGLIANPKKYSLSDLQKLPYTQEYSTFVCVSNEIDGSLISNAKWGGVRLLDLFADAGGVSEGATYVVFRSVDGYSVGIPLTKALESESMLAYEMNGVALPQAHGYPLRAVIPGLYGMMSAKWVNQIDLSDSVYVGYWQTRGWSNDATVQTAVFIRTPEDGATLSLSRNGGSLIIGGVAFAGDRGISKVELSFDGGSTWQRATLKPPISNLTWVLWAFEWYPPSPGQYEVYARATDGNNDLQTANQSGPFPAGATGYVMSTVDVTS
jgi:DMSO/TMAO reductase YedYZ molybdopterin-dependent catalytic subunit